jgi:glutamate decarboxylase
MSAEYLFQRDKFYDLQYDTGDKVIQCGRHNDVFKLWLQWRAKGTSGLAQHVDHQMEMTKYLVERMRSMPTKYHLIVPEPEYVNVNFWYIPKRLRTIPHNRERALRLGEATSLLKRKMVGKGSLMLNTQRKGSSPFCFEAVLSNPAIKRPDVDALLVELDRLGEDL